MRKTQFSLLFRFLAFLLPYRKIWFLILILSGLGSLLSLVNPYLSKLVIDKGIGNRDLKIFILLAVIGGGVFVFNGLVNGLIQFLERYIKVKANFNLNKKVFRHLQNLSFSYFTERATGEHLYKISYDIERATEFIATTPPQAISLFPRMLLILGIVFFLNWKMAMLLLILAPFLYLPNYYFVRKMRKAWQALIENSQSIFKVLSENFSHIQLIKTFGREAKSIRQYLRMLIGNIRIRIQNTKLEVSSGFVSQSLDRVIAGLIAFYGGYQVIKGRMTLGSLTAIMVYLSQLMGLQNKFAYFFQTTALGLVSCQRLAEVLDEKATVLENKEAKEIRLQNGRIVFKEVSFGYKPNEPVLKSISFIIEEKKTIALVGPSGCGKTTILNLILRLYDPQSGDIMIDGYNIKGLRLSSLRGQIGIVLQEPFLFNDTIENNIRYGRPDAGKEEIIEVAKICGVDDFTRDLPHGYRTVIGENACKISEGQKQKIAIARALIKRPKILILDEAMSSVDSQSEERIMLKIRQMPEVLTVIIVSHRLSTVMKVDLAYFLKKPDTMVIGKPQRLLENDEEFYNLFAAQMKGYAKEELFIASKNNRAQNDPQD